MQPTARRGIFVAIDGPKHIDKAPTVELLARSIAALRGQQCLCLAQPSDTQLGHLLRHNSEGMTGHAYAMALAADRLFQYDQSILPALTSGVSVVINRYTPSSLVLQRPDLDLEEIWAYNQHTPAPDVLFYLCHSAKDLRRQVRESNQRSRVRSLGAPMHESEYYEDARAFLTEKGWLQRRIDGGETPVRVANAMLRFIRNNPAL